MNNKNIISPRGRDFLLYGRKKRYAELMGISNHKSLRIKSLRDNKLIGRFSCLSISDLANITSYYEGKAYYYVMNKDVDQLHIDLLDVLPTEEHNGVDVKVPIKSWEPETLSCLAFIDNIYVESEDHNDQYLVGNFNKRKIHTFKNFKALSINGFQTEETTEILLGKIPYKVDYRDLWDYSDHWHRSWEKCFYWVYPQIEIGQVDITPNREGLLYSERTKDVLRKAYDACIDELEEMWNNACTQEYEDIWEYMQRITSYVDNRLKLTGTDLTIPVSDELHYNAAYKKYKEWDTLSTARKSTLIRGLYNRSVDVLGRLCGDTLHQGKRQERWFTLRKLLESWVNNKYNTDRKVIALPSKAGFSSQYFKGYIIENYGTDEILFIRKYSFITVSYIKHFIRTIWGITTLNSTQELRFIMQLLREVLAYLKGKIIITDIVGSPDYEKYKKEHTVKKAKAAMPTEDICFTITNYGYSQKHTTKLGEIIPYIKNNCGKKSHIVYADLDNPLTMAFGDIRYPNLVVLSTAKNKMHLLRNNLPSWVKPIESLYSPDNRVLQKFAAMYFITHYPNIDTSFSRYSFFPKPVRDINDRLQKLQTIYGYKHNDWDTDAKTVIQMVPPEKWDKEIMALFNQNKKWLELSERMDSKKALYSYNSDYAFYILMKHKKFRMDWEFYHNMKKKVNLLLETI